jgi:aldose sugar dehydrogenase
MPFLLPLGPTRIGIRRATGTALAPTPHARAIHTEPTMPPTAARSRAASAALVAAALLAAGCPGNDTPPAQPGAAAREQAGPAGEAGPPLEPGAAVEHDVVTVVEGLEHPWGLAFLPDGALLVTERPGRLRLVRDGRLEPQPIAGVPQVRARGQGGLLDVALHPDFANNRLVYLTYSKPGPRGATTALARGRLEAGRLAGVEDLFIADAWTGADQHFGSRIAFDRDGYLYLTIGDRGTPRRAQDLSDHVGTTIRLHDDGRVPRDNPFAGRAGARDEIFTYGNRNAQGMAVHPGTGELWQSEHGPRGGDELNRMVAGANYGWPGASFGNHYDGRRIADPAPGDGFQPPVAHWTPAIAPAGMTIYDGDAFPHWRGDLFIAALAGQHLRRVRVEGGEVVEQERLLDRGQRLRHVATGPDGLLYVLVDARRAPLLRIQPATARETAAPPP